jgi:hypothetical protein
MKQKLDDLLETPGIDELHLATPTLCFIPISKGSLCSGCQI